MNPGTQFFYYYRRYKWRAADFTLLQQSIIEQLQGRFEGLSAAAVLSGFECTPATGSLNISVAPGIGISSTGGLSAVSGTTSLSFTAPATGAQKNLIVLRPAPYDANNIVQPTTPFQLVPLNTVLFSQVVAITGVVSATPSYPSAASGDTVLGGVKISAGDTVISAVDYVVRDRLGKNSDLGGMQGWDYVVGTGTKLRTHQTLAQFAADTGVARGSKVLVTSNETVNSTLVLSVPELTIEFLPGVTLTKGTAATGIQVAASGVHLIRPRMAGFSGGSDIAIAFSGEYGVIERGRWNNCTKEYDDSLTTKGVSVYGSVTE